MTRTQWILAGISGAIVTALLLVVGLIDGWDFGETLGVAGLMVSMAGFSLAIIEIRRAQTVSRATGVAVQKTLKSVAASRLAVSTTVLRQLVTQLEEAATSEDPRAAQRILNQWRDTGTDAEGLVRRRFGVQADALPILRESIDLARETKASLFQDPEDLSAALAECLKGMAAAVDALGPLLEQLLPSTEDDEDG